MQTSISFISSHGSSSFRKSLKTEPTQYIFNQHNNDHHLSILLCSLSEFNTIIERKEIQRGKQLCNQIAQQLDKIDQKHRSYVKVRSLVIGTLILAYIYMEQEQRLIQLMEEEESLCVEIGTNQFIAKAYLFRILFFWIQYKKNVSQQMKQAIKREVQKNYKEFSKIKFQSPTNKNPLSMCLWQYYKILEILVYQYILIVQKLADFDPVKSSFLYKRGLLISRKLLGKNHKIVVMLEKIRRIRLETNKLINLDITESNMLRNEGKRNKTLLQKKLYRVVNPEKFFHDKRREKKIEGELGERNNKKMNLNPICITKNKIKNKQTQTSFNSNFCSRISEKSSKKQLKIKSNEKSEDQSKPKTIEQLLDHKTGKAQFQSQKKTISFAHNDKGLETKGLEARKQAPQLAPILLGNDLKRLESEPKKEENEWSCQLI